MLKNLVSRSGRIKSRIINGTNHTFGGKHLYNVNTLPANLLHVCYEANAFFKNVQGDGLIASSPIYLSRQIFGLRQKPGLIAAIFNYKPFCEELVPIKN